MNPKLITQLLILTLLYSPVHAKSFGDYEGAVYVRNYDGDTITFTLPSLHPIIGEKISIRVNGIDTLEIKVEILLAEVAMTILMKLIKP